MVKAGLWELVQSLLWQSISKDPGSIRFVIDVLLLNTHFNKDLQLDKPMAESALNSMIESSAPVGHGSEVVWSIWAALLFNLKLSDVSQEAIAKMDDSFVAVAAFIASERGIFRDKITSSTWGVWLEEGCFKESHWLFVYEAYRHNWMKKEVKTAKLQDDRCCKFIKEGSVSFINEKIIANYKPKRSRIPLLSMSVGY